MLALKVAWLYHSQCTFALTLRRVTRALPLISKTVAAISVMCIRMRVERYRQRANMHFNCCVQLCHPTRMEERLHQRPGFSAEINTFDFRTRRLVLELELMVQDILHTLKKIVATFNLLYRDSSHCKSLA